jgi:hypothetical protein
MRTDRGFCSKESLQFLCGEQVDFVIRLPKSHKIFHTFVAQAKNIENVKNAVQCGERAVFIKSYKSLIYGHSMYVNVVFDASKRGKDTPCILRN